jgi:hypothetical protein
VWLRVASGLRKSGAVRRTTQHGSVPFYTDDVRFATDLTP